jgi:hypothetical protein
MPLEEASASCLFLSGRARLRLLSVGTATCYTVHKEVVNYEININNLNRSHSPKQCCESELVSMRIRIQLVRTMRIQIRVHGLTQKII